MRQLPNVYDVGNVQFTHAGYRVHKIVGKFSKPMEPVGKIHDTPEAALKALDGVEDGYADQRTATNRVSESIEMIFRFTSSVTSARRELDDRYPAHRMG